MLSQYLCLLQPYLNEFDVMEVTITYYLHATVHTYVSIDDIYSALLFSDSQENE